MSTPPQFQSGDRVKITMEVTVRDAWYTDIVEGATNKRLLGRWASQDHIDVELIERPEPPPFREPGWYPCNLDGGRTIYLLRWNGKSWNWPQGTPRVTAKVDVVGDRVTLSEGFEP